MKHFLIAVTVLLIAAACNQTTNTTDPLVNGKLNKAWLKKLEKESDSTYHKRYFRRDFVTAWYFYNKKDSSVCNEMRDSSENVRQVLITKNDIRTFYAQFYPNGQVLMKAGLNKTGQLEGETINYYSDGKISSKGNYANGLLSGNWEYYDANGKLVKTEQFDSNGAIKNTVTY